MGRDSTRDLPLLRPEFMRLPQVLKWSGLGRSTIYRMVATGDFPPPVRIGLRAVAWRLNDLECWGASRDGQRQLAAAPLMGHRTATRRTPTHANASRSVAM
jgi:prophage regulatory protein